MDLNIITSGPIDVTEKGRALWPELRSSFKPNDGELVDVVQGLAKENSDEEQSLMIGLLMKLRDDRDELHAFTHALTAGHEGGQKCPR
jgi:hypothetical protein